MPEMSDSNISLNMTYGGSRLEDATDNSMSVLEPIGPEELHGKDIETPECNHVAGGESPRSTDCFVLEDLKHTLSTILEDQLGFSDISCDNVPGRNENSEDSTLLSSIYSLFLTMNDKIDKINMSLGSSSSCRTLLRRILASLSAGNTEAVRSQLMELHFVLFGDVKISFKNEQRALCLLKSIRDSVVPDVLGLMKDVRRLVTSASRQDAEIRAMLDAQDIEIRNIRKTGGEAVTRLENSLARSESDAKERNKQVDLLCGCIADLNHFLCGHPVNFLDEREIKRFFQKVKDEVRKMREESTELKTQNRELKTQPRETELLLREKLEKSEEAIKRLREENARTAAQISKVIEKHRKYKKELGVLSSEVMKIREASKKKTEVIERQKGVINMLQRKATDMSPRFPIADLEAKIEKLRTQMEGESDAVKRKRIMLEISDHERLLGDFRVLRRGHVQES
eukprot:jgi/Antlo1/327/1653